MPTSSGESVTPGVVLSGLPGVGKTALAIHVAHRLRPIFPDGQLYLNMLGYSQSQPMPPAAALVRFLRALGIAPNEIPANLDEQSALFRTVLTDYRILVVLDNVMSADQVRPLLPGRSGCAVLVTSRNILRGLSAINGMHSVAVDPVSSHEAVALLTTILGERVDREPTASTELASRCGNLPLALRIAAANLVARPDQSIESYAKDLRLEDRLGALAIDGDDDAAVEIAFDLSYRILDADAARMFRLLGMIPGPDFDKYAAANIADLDLTAARRILDRLAGANLIQHSLDRYHFHDLILEYARRKSLTVDGSQADLAVRRLFDFYLKTADEATRLLHRDLPRIALSSPPISVVKPSIDEPSAAAGWLDAEIANMEAMVCSTAPGDEGLPVWLLADAMLGHVERQRLDTSWHAICTAARDRAIRCGDQAANAAMSLALGKLHYLQARYDRAEELYLQTGEIYEVTGDPLGQARVLNGLASVAGSLLNYTRANQYLHVALQACRAADDREGETETLVNLGTSLVLMGSADEGVAYLTQACTVATQLNLVHLHPRAQSAIALNQPLLREAGGRRKAPQ